MQKNEQFEQRISDVEVNRRKLEARLDNLENRSRRTNLVFFGIPDDTVRESWEESETLVRRICKGNLDIDVTSIQRAHRLGTFKERSCRPIIASFQNWKERDNIMRNAFKFKNSAYSVSEDFSALVREKRRKLWDYSKEKRQDKNNKVYLTYDKLVINGDTYAWDFEQSMPILVRKKAPPIQQD